MECILFLHMIGRRRELGCAPRSGALDLNLSAAQGRDPCPGSFALLMSALHGRLWHLETIFERVDSAWGSTPEIPVIGPGRSSGCGDAAILPWAPCRRSQDSRREHCHKDDSGRWAHTPTPLLAAGRHADPGAVGRPGDRSSMLGAVVCARAPLQCTHAES